jgi:P pilus assembly chaperone PapD
MYNSVRNLKAISCAVLASGLLWSSAYASEISISPMVVDFAPKQAFQDITINNVGDDKAYVVIKIERVDNAGMPNQTMVQSAGNPMQFGLTASLTKMVIPVGQSRMVRLLSLVRNNPQDMIYRVIIAPVAGEAEMTGADQAGHVDTGMEIRIDYSALAILRPANPEPVINFTRKGKEITITNTGNTNALIYSYQQCPTGQACEKLQLPEKRLYAGNTWTFSMPYDAPLQLTAQYLDTTKQLTSQ